MKKIVFILLGISQIVIGQDNPFYLINNINSSNKNSLHVVNGEIGSKKYSRSVIKNEPNKEILFVETGDFNGDGIKDIFYVIDENNGKTKGVGIDGSNSSDLWYFSDDNNRVWNGKVKFILVGNFINNDEYEDICIVRESGNNNNANALFVINGKTGKKSLHENVFVDKNFPNSQVTHLTSGDFNGDGIDDIYYIYETFENRKHGVLLGNGGNISYWESNFEGHGSKWGNILNVQSCYSDIDKKSNVFYIRKSGNLKSRVLIMLDGANGSKKWGKNLVTYEDEGENEIQFIRTGDFNGDGSIDIFYIKDLINESTRGFFQHFAIDGLNGNQIWSSSNTQKWWGKKIKFTLTGNFVNNDSIDDICIVRESDTNDNALFVLNGQTGKKSLLEGGNFVDKNFINESVLAISKGKFNLDASDDIYFISENQNSRKHGSIKGNGNGDLLWEKHLENSRNLEGKISFCKTINTSKQITPDRWTTDQNWLYKNGHKFFVIGAWYTRGMNGGKIDYNSAPPYSIKPNSADESNVVGLYTSDHMLNKINFEKEFEMFNTLVADEGMEWPWVVENRLMLNIHQWHRDLAMEGGVSLNNAKAIAEDESSYWKNKQLNRIYLHDEPYNTKGNGNGFSDNDFIRASENNRYDYFNLWNKTIKTNDTGALTFMDVQAGGGCSNVNNFHGLAQNFTPLNSLEYCPRVKALASNVSYDLLSQQFYSVNGDAIKNIAKIVRGIKGISNKPCFVFLDAEKEDSSVDDMVIYEEALKAEAYVSMIHGAAGIMFWRRGKLAEQTPEKIEIWNAVKRISQNLRDKEHIFSGTYVSGEEAENNIHKGRFKSINGNLYDILVNASQNRSNVGYLMFNEPILLKPREVYVKKYNSNMHSKSNSDLSIKDSSLSVFPNPVNGIVNLSLKLFQNSNLVFEIFNTEGVRIVNLNLGMYQKGINEITLDSSNFNLINNGLYILKITINNLSNKEVIYKKVVFERD